MAKYTDSSDWDFQYLDDIQLDITKAAQHFKLEPYKYQLEIVSSEQMLDLYADVGMPISYSHWSKGKERIASEKKYKKGEMGLAFEIVINTDPSIAYLMESNTKMMQCLVIAHAIYGHSTFFKNNYLFKEWTDASTIIDYMSYAKKFISSCEEKYGEQEVEWLLDSCHTIQNYGVNKYKRPQKLSFEKERARVKDRDDYLQSQVNDLWRTIPKKQKTKNIFEDEDYEDHDDSDNNPLKEPQENLLYFIEKHSPILKPWQREIVRIVRHIAQYFYPQMQTQLINEGFATFTHYNILNKLYDDDIVGEGFMLEFLASHAGVTRQDPMTSINPYALGFAMFQDIRRICENPTQEDKVWFPDLIGKDWIEETNYIMANFKDESFISQYLSPKVIRDFHMFSLVDDDRNPHMNISEIHDDEGYRKLRNALSNQYNLSNRLPNIQIVDYDAEGFRGLILKYDSHNRHSLDRNFEEVLLHIEDLWGFDVGFEVI